MNQNDRAVMSNFKTKVDDLRTKQMDLDRKVDLILRTLEDDKYSSSTGLITEVNELRDQMHKLMYINRSIKRIFWWIMGILSTCLAFIINSFFKDA
tara:strand:- start:334 stop:621 length:288 start_codon:yes stop_codon:yes gene_type:complete